MTALPWSGRRRRKPGSVRSLVKEATRGSAMTEREVVVSFGLLTISIILLWLVVQMLALGNLSYARTQDRLYQDFRVQLAKGEAPTGGIIAPGKPVALLQLKALGIDQVVVEGTSSGQLMGAPGHRRDTVLPGQRGVAVLYGRSKTFGRPFDVMMHAAVGKNLTVVTAQGTSVYKIEQVRRAGDPVPAPPAADHGRMTLVTSEGSGPLSGLRPGHVVYVDASLQTKAFAPGPSRVNTVSQSEDRMSSDTSVLPMLALTLGGLLVAVVLVPLALRRFGAVLTWMTAVPVVLALGWFAADLTVYLLPNLM